VVSNNCIVVVLVYVTLGTVTNCGFSHPNRGAEAACSVRGSSSKWLLCEKSD
jgi:hypothetical protein